MKDNSNANKYTNVNLGEHIPERKFQLFKRGATSPGVYSSNDRPQKLMLERRTFHFWYLNHKIEMKPPNNFEMKMREKYMHNILKIIFQNPNVLAKGDV